MKLDDAREFAEAVGLRYVSSEEPGIRRIGCGKGFTYRTSTGETIGRKDPRRERIEALAIPPAWRDVWVCPHENGHLQAVGVDTADRRQYRYHDTWDLQRRSWRFSRLSEFARVLPGLRRRVRSALDPSATTHDSVHAAAARILDVLALRVGNPVSAAAAETFGLTTLHVTHAEIGKRDIALAFRGKGGTERSVDFRDPKIAAILEAASDHEDEHLLSWREGDRCGHVTGASLRAWLKDATQAPVTARMFRTWHASVRALDGVRKADWGPPSVSAFTDILEPIARDLGHTLATCRTYYVHEAIEQRYLAGELAGYSESVDLRGLYAGEKRCLALVDEHAVRIGRRVAA